MRHPGRCAMAAIAVIVSLATFVPAVARTQSRSSTPDTVVVSPAGPVRTVTAALALVAIGGHVIVRPGVYREPTIIVSRPVEIVGDRYPTLDGQGARQIMIVTADDVTVRGLRFAHVGTSFVEDRAAIRFVSARACAVLDNRFDDAFFAIYLAQSTDCRIERNVIHGNAATESTSGNGIHLWSSRRVTIADNRISGHRDGIYFEFVHDSRIERNTSEGNLRYGLHFMYSDDCHYTANTFRRNGSGVAVMYTKRVEMTDNTFDTNWGAAAYGLLLKEISDVTLTGNVFRRNTTGLLADGAARLVADHNEFIANGWALELEANTVDSRVTANNFAGNTFDVTTNGRGGGTTFAGNYWDSYAGYDLNRDGVGDVPHHPVRLFSLIAQRNETSLVLLHSALVGVLDAAERVIPSLTPETMVDSAPAMQPTRHTRALVLSQAYP
jgi:nitrous oxidase accessory protein